MEIEINKYGSRFWRNQDGQYHREDGPAIEGADGSKEWYLNDQFHREDGPAVEYADGWKEWWVNDQLHREDGPAIEYVNGSKEWWLNGQLHREDGPAIEWADGTKEWWLNGQKLTKDIVMQKSTSDRDKIVQYIENCTEKECRDLEKLIFARLRDLRIAENQKRSKKNDTIRQRKKKLEALGLEMFANLKVGDFVRVDGIKNKMYPWRQVVAIEKNSFSGFQCYKDKTGHFVMGKEYTTHMSNKIREIA
jgi:hypothetical protein